MAASQTAAQSSASTQRSSTAEDAAHKVGDYHRLAQLRAQSPRGAGTAHPIGVDRFVMTLGLGSTLAFLSVIAWVYTFHHI